MMNLILWIYPESIASSHVNLCALIFLIWKDTSFIIMYENENCLNLFFKTSLVVVCSSSFHWWRGGEKERSQGLKLMWIQILVVQLLLWIKLGKLAFQEYQSNMAIINNITTNNSCETNAFYHSQSFLDDDRGNVHEVIFRNFDWIGNFHLGLICEKKRCERKLWCIEFGNQINTMDLI